jgi:ribosome-associated protein
MNVVGDSYLAVTKHLSIPLTEIRFRTSRSGGPGGQNVNKLETRVEALFDVINSPSLSQQQRVLVLRELAGRIDDSGVLRVVAQESRSQYQNKAKALIRLAVLLQTALKPKRIRIRTKPGRSAQERRLRSKKIHSEKKRTRSAEPD